MDKAENMDIADLVAQADAEVNTWLPDAPEPDAPEPDATHLATSPTPEEILRALFESAEPSPEPEAPPAGRPPAEVEPSAPPAGRPPTPGPPAPALEAWLRQHIPGRGRPRINESERQVLRATLTPSAPPVTGVLTADEWAAAFAPGARVKRDIVSAALEASAIERAGVGPDAELRPGALPEAARFARDPRILAPEALLSELDLLPKAPKIRKGRIGTSSPPEWIRDLNASDIAALTLPRGTHAPTLKRIHSSHHALARCLATGMKQGDAAHVAGYSVARVAQLVDDPTFSALVADYREDTKSIVADMTERMANLSMDALETIHDRLQEDPNQFSLSFLLEMARTFADRTGHGPGSKMEIGLTAEAIDRPPRETHDEWVKRRKDELDSSDDVVSPAGTTDGSNYRRLVS